jgi:hypothetical protein
MTDMQAQLDLSIAQVPAATESFLRSLIDECGTPAAIAGYSTQLTEDSTSSLYNSWQKFLASSVR